MSKSVKTWVARVYLEFDGDRCIGGYFASGWDRSELDTWCDFSESTTSSELGSMVTQAAHAIRYQRAAAR